MKDKTFIIILKLVFVVMLLSWRYEAFSFLEDISFFLFLGLFFIPIDYTKINEQNNNNNYDFFAIAMILAWAAGCVWVIKETIAFFF